MLMGPPPRASSDEHATHASSTEPALRPAKLPALTSLRFFGAAMIVFAHTAGGFGTYPTAEQGAAWYFTLGVSFFYVLSGFILAYVYPDPRATGLRKFWLARIARIWPAHLAAFLILLAIVPRREWTPPFASGIDVVLSNLLLVHSWLPISRYSYSYNAVSWSLSVELAFYLLFPFLLVACRRRPLLMLAPMFAVSFGLGLSANNAWLPLPTGWSAGDLALRTPWPRLFEFVTGIVTALVWKRISPRVSVSVAVATATEAAVVALAIWFTHFAAVGGQQLTTVPWLGVMGRLALVYTLSALVFALVIFVMAFHRGLLSRALAIPPMQLLGEISYSIYLLHYVLLLAYRADPGITKDMTGAQSYLAYWIVVLMASFIVWTLVETPARRWLTGLWPRQTRSVPAGRSGPTWLSPNPLVAWLVLALTIGGIGVGIYQSRPPSLAALTPSTFSIHTDFRVNEKGTVHLKEPSVLEQAQIPDDGVLVDGWVVDPVLSQVVSGIYVSVDDRHDIRASYGFTRPDVAKHFSKPQYLHAGFFARIPRALLTSGDHRVTLKVVSVDGTAWAQSDAIAVVVK